MEKRLKGIQLPQFPISSMEGIHNFYFPSKFKKVTRALSSIPAETSVEIIKWWDDNGIGHETLYVSLTKNE